MTSLSMWSLNIVISAEFVHQKSGYLWPDNSYSCLHKGAESEKKNARPMILSIWIKMTKNSEISSEIEPKEKSSSFEVVEVPKGLKLTIQAQSLKTVAVPICMVI